MLITGVVSILTLTLQCGRWDAAVRKGAYRTSRATEGPASNTLNASSLLPSDHLPLIDPYCRVRRRHRAPLPKI